MEQLGTLKMLLGIKDDEQDSLLSFLIEDTVNMIMAYCHIDVLPRQLESLVPISTHTLRGERDIQLCVKRRR